MPVTNWREMKSCGDPPAGCERMKERVFGRAPVVSHDDNCPIELLSQEYPGVVVASSINRTEIRSGSKNQPLMLPKLQELRSESINAITGQKSDGTLVSWTPLERCINRKVIATPTGFSLVYDQNSNVFDNACIGDISDVEYIAGAVLFTDCEGNQKIQLKFFPVAQLTSS